MITVTESAHREIALVEEIAKFIERGSGCAALDRLKVGPRGSIARAIREKFGAVSDH